MFPDACERSNPYLLMRILDTVPIRLCREKQLLSICRPLPECFRLEHAHLSGSPYLTDQRFSPRNCGTNLSATLHLPLHVVLLTPCGKENIEGEICIPICAVLRCKGCGNEQIIPQACVRVLDACLDCGGLCLTMDVEITLYVARLVPASLPYPPMPENNVPGRAPSLPL